MCDIEQLNRWLISEGRILGDETEIVRHYCESLQNLGLPLARARIAQSYLNPLLSAWGIIWTPTETRRYTVNANVLATGAWMGSPFEYVVTTRQPLRKQLTRLDLSQEHPLYGELVATGATDFLAVPLEYGDGSVQGSSFSTNDPDGFTEENTLAILNSRHALAAALEPIAMRQSQKSLLQTYLGVGPAKEIGQGHINRGEHKTVSAAILFVDLRGFTAKSETWQEADLLQMMGDYFEMVVTPIQNYGGDVLKFMGDGILAIFQSKGAPNQACDAALEATRQALNHLQSYNADASAQGKEQIDFVTGIDFGEVTFGNIGSPDRLDFTVVGPTVNIASRVQGLCKDLGAAALVTADVARNLSDPLPSVGFHLIRGVPQRIEVFAVAKPDA